LLIPRLGEGLLAGAPDIAISDFDLSRDGRAVLFDRIQERSRIALIRLASAKPALARAR
jgi:hypothetical protein